jgi:hypothetical protein
VPVLVDSMVRQFEHLATLDSKEDGSWVIYLLRSDGMNKQKNVGHRAMLAVQGSRPDLLSKVCHVEATGATSALCRSAGSRPHRVRLWVCFCTERQKPIEISIIYVHSTRCAIGIAI